MTLSIQYFLQAVSCILLESGLFALNTIDAWRVKKKQKRLQSWWTFIFFKLNLQKKYTSRPMKSKLHILGICKWTITHIKS